MKRGLVSAVVLLSLAACSSSQDPGIPGPERAGTTPATTGDPAGGVTPPSYLYPPRCPEGGPDATTPKAGCLLPDGSLVRP